MAKLPKEEVAVDLNLVTAEWDGAHIVFVPKLSRRRWQSTYPSSSLRIEMCLGELRRVLDYS